MIWLFAGSAVTKLALTAGGAALLSGPLNSPQTWISGRSPDTPPLATRLASPGVRIVVASPEWSQVLGWGREESHGDEALFGRA